jgi:putative hydrolase of the HAD superfamily
LFLADEVKTFVFDADGVLCVGERFDLALEKRHGIPRARLAPFFSGPFSECVLGRADLKEMLAPHLSEWGWSRSVEELLGFWFQCEHVVSADVLACVRALRKKGHLCALATNQEKHRASYMRREMRLAEEFDHIFVSCELGAAKPERVFFDRVKDQLTTAAAEICLLDDSERNVIGARAAGWSAIWYRSVADLPAAETEAGRHHTNAAWRASNPAV